MTEYIVYEAGGLDLNHIDFVEARDPDKAIKIALRKNPESYSEFTQYLAVPESSGTLREIASIGRKGNGTIDKISLRPV